MLPSSVALVGLWLAAGRLVAAQTCAPCEDVHFFLARGNNEPYPGRQAALVSATCDGLSSCGYEDLIYSALFTDLSCQTTYDGVIAGQTQMAAYAERCPDSKLILAGYSQGAQIVTDILGGGGGVSFNGCVQPNTPALDITTSPGKNIAAIISFGNTRHTANQPYNFDNGSTYDGLFPRSGAMLTALDVYKGILRDWCLETDPVCADNQTNSLVSTHLGYYNVYSDAAASWIKSVASITDDSDFHTSIALSISGTAQDYATVGTATPSGTVTLVTTTPSVDCATATSTSPVDGAVSSLNSTRIPASTSHVPSSISRATLTSTNPSSTGGAAVGGASASASASTTADASNSASTPSIHASNLGLVLLLSFLVVIAL